MGDEPKKLLEDEARSPLNTHDAPPDGFEVTVRASTGTLGFAWSGKAGEAMTKAMLYAVALAAQGCPPPQSTPPLQYDFWRVI